jgi:glucosyltransferase
MKNKSLISIMICNYNYGQYIGEAIESALNQTYPNIELIIIDDGSTDNSREVIEKYVGEYPEIRYYKQRNQGVVPTRNRGLELAEGDFLMFLDSDDIIPNNYVAELYNVAVAKSVDVVYAGLKCFGANETDLDTPDYSLGELKYHNFINAEALVKKSIIKDHRFDINLNKKLNHEDWDFFLGLALDGAKIAKTSETYVMYRVHNDSRSSNGRGADTKKAAKSLEYIVEKYAKKYNYSAKEQYVKCIEGYMKQTVKAKNITDYNEARIRDLENQLAAVKNSRSYRLGRVLTSPTRFFGKR